MAWIMQAYIMIMQGERHLACIERGNPKSSIYGDGEDKRRRKVRLIFSEHRQKKKWGTRLHINVGM